MRLHEMTSTVLAFLVFACGAPKPEPAPPATITVTVDEHTRPEKQNVERLSGGASSDFVGDQLILSASDRASLDAAIARLNATVESTDSVGGMFFATVTLPATPEANAADLAADLSALAPGVHSGLTVSSPRALRLLALAAKEARLGQVSVGLNFLMTPDGIAEGHTAEASNDDAFKWSYFNSGSNQNFGVGRAWQVLEEAGRLGNKVPIAIFDDGFTQHPDLPAGAVVVPANGWSQPNQGLCGGSPCLWHGTAVATTLVGVLDNQAGAAGVAGPVVGELTLLRNPEQTIGGLLAYLKNLGVALNRKPRIINISSSFEVPAGAAFTTDPLDAFMRGLRADGVLVFASAGNKGEDVDEKSEALGFDWESKVVAPCELDTVVCVGGLDMNSTTRFQNSSWGHRQRGSQNSPQFPFQEDSSVDLYGPFFMLAQAEPDANGNVPAGEQWVGGTSFSSPFVAGVAALVWAADPKLTADQVFELLMKTSVSRAQPSAPFVLQQVDAFAAVKAATGNLKPTVKIVTPTPGASVQVGLPGAQFSAKVDDFEDEPGTLTVEWRSDVDFKLFTGAQGTWQFPSLGKRIITVRVTDSNGAWAEDSVVIDVVGYTITFTVTQPTNLSPVINKDVVFSVGIDDIFTTHTCRWRSDKAGDAMYGLAGLTGCTGVITQFSTLGPRTIYVTVEDEYGQSAMKSFVLDVVPPPPGPVVTITSPSSNDVAHTGDTVILSASISAPQGIASRAWTFVSNTSTCAPVVLTTKPPTVTYPGAPYSVLWDTTSMASVPNNCGVGPGRIVLTVTDNGNQQGQGDVQFVLLTGTVIP